MAKTYDYEKFYKLEIAIRKALNYPPFKDILQFKIVSYNEKKAAITAKKLKNSLIEMKEKLRNKEMENFLNCKNQNEKKEIQENIKILDEMEILNEAPFRIDKIMNQYRWKVIVKCKFNKYLANAVNFILKNIGNEKDPLVTAELNPFNM